MEAKVTSRTHKDYIKLVKRLPLVTIHSESQYKKSLTILKDLSIKDTKMTKGEFEYFEVLSLLVKCYEGEHFRFTHPIPQAVLRSFMGDYNLTQAVIADIAGDYESNISAFLAEKRNLTKQAALRLGTYFSVDPVLFLQRSFGKAS